MKDESRNVIVGITALAGLVGLAAMLVLFGYVPGMLEKGYSVSVELAHAGGLSKGSLARLSGIPIGRITSIELASTPRTGVVAVLLIDQDVRIPQNVQVAVAAPILTGSAWLAFGVPVDPEGTEAVGVLPTDGSAVLQGQVPELVSELAGAMRSALAGSVDSIRSDLRPALARFDRIEQSLNDLSEQWTEVGKRVNNLIEDRAVEEVDEGTVDGNLATVLKRMDTRLAEAKELLANARQWIDQVADATGEVHSTVAKAGRAADKTTQSIEQLTLRYVALADDLSRTIGDMQKLATQASTGQGTMGKLLNDPAVYDNLDDTVKRIGQVANELKLLLEKWKAEGVPVQF